MKLKNFKLVAKIVELREKCVSELKDAKSWLKDAECEVSKEHDLFSGGYFMFMAQHTDHSGYNVDAGECYIGKGVVKATIKLLEEKIQTIDETLTGYGVEV